jgi:hypothetical protein
MIELYKLSAWSHGQKFFAAGDPVRFVRRSDATRLYRRKDALAIRRRFAKVQTAHCPRASTAHAAVCWHWMDEAI